MGLDWASKVGFRRLRRYRALRRVGEVALAGTAALPIALTAPREAKACSYAAPPPALVGSPADGDVNVPLDVVPYYSRAATMTPDATNIPWSLVSADGDVVSVAIETTYGDTFELVPSTTLDPNTEYTLSVTLNTGYDGAGESVVEQVTFTTGDSAYDGVPEPPDASLVHYRFDESLSSSCSPSEAGTCVAFPKELPVAVVYIDEFGQELHPALYTNPFFTNLSGVDQGTNFDCAQLRSRAPNGTLSEPTELCRGDGPRYTLDSDEEDIACTSKGLEQGGEVVTEDTSGCSITAPGGSTRSAALTVTLLALASFGRRARRQPRR